MAIDEQKVKRAGIDDPDLKTVVGQLGWDELAEGGLVPSKFSPNGAAMSLHADFWQCPNLELNHFFICFTCHQVSIADNAKVKIIMSGPSIAFGNMMRNNIVIADWMRK